MSYIPLATVTLGGSDSDIIFSNIPATFKDLVLVFNGKNNVTGPDSIVIQFNSDTGSNYANIRMVGTGSSATSYADTAAFAYIGVGTNSSNPFTITTQIMDYAATDKHKTLLSRCSQDNGWVTAHAGRWASTSAITSLKVWPPTGSSWTFSTGATFSLYGVA
jgi:hypothetical protein